MASGPRPMHSMRMMPSCRALAAHHQQTAKHQSCQDSGSPPLSPTKAAQQRLQGDLPSLPSICLQVLPFGDHLEHKAVTYLLNIVSDTALYVSGPHLECSPLLMQPSLQVSSCAQV